MILFTNGSKDSSAQRVGIPATNLRPWTVCEQMNFAGVIPGKTNVLEASTELSTWISIGTNVCTTNMLTTVESTAANFTHSYYRLAQLP